MEGSLNSPDLQIPSFPPEPYLKNPPPTEPFSQIERDVYEDEIEKQKAEIKDWKKGEPTVRRPHGFSSPMPEMPPEQLLPPPETLEPTVVPTRWQRLLGGLRQVGNRIIGSRIMRDFFNVHPATDFELNLGTPQTQTAMNINEQEVIPTSPTLAASTAPSFPEPSVPPEEMPAEMPPQKIGLILETMQALENVKQPTEKRADDSTYTDFRQGIILWFKKIQSANALKNFYDLTLTRSKEPKILLEAFWLHKALLMGELNGHPPTTFVNLALTMDQVYDPRIGEENLRRMKMEEKRQLLEIAQDVMEAYQDHSNGSQWGNLSFLARQHLNLVAAAVTSKLTRDN